MNKNIITIVGLIWVATAVAHNAQAYFDQGSAAVSGGNYGTAASALQQASATGSDDAETHFFAGEAHYREGRFAQAIKSYQSAVRLYPSFARAYNNMGDAYKGQGQYAEAIRSYQSAIRIKPDFVEAYCNMGTAYEDSGDLGAALAAFEQALRIDPNYGYAKYGLFALRERTQSSAPAASQAPPRQPQRPQAGQARPTNGQALNPAEQEAANMGRQPDVQQAARPQGAQRSDGQLAPRQQPGGQVGANGRSAVTQPQANAGTASRRPQGGSSLQAARTSREVGEGSRAASSVRDSEVIRDEASKPSASASADMLNLEGRSVRGGAALIKPLGVTGAGEIVVHITVDAHGTVVGAAVDRKLSTIKDKQMRKEALLAARSTPFDDAPGRSRQKGSITYRFGVNDVRK
jgi:Tfp pilus assembly protein PilF